jgi:hypothetical protein
MSKFNHGVEEDECDEEMRNTYLSLRNTGTLPPRKEDSENNPGDEVSDDDWEEATLREARNAELEYDAVEMLVELNVEKHVWNMQNSDKLIKDVGDVLHEKFGEESWRRISAQVAVLVKREVANATGSKDFNPVAIIPIQCTSSRDASVEET